MTTIGRRINTAIDHISKKDYENALIQISITIDSTAKKKWLKDEVGSRIRKHIKAYEPLIYQFASVGGLIICGGGCIVMQGKELPQIVYKLIRCALHHGDELSDKIIFKEGFNTLGVKNGKIIINTGHIYGLLFSVIVDPINCNESCESNPILFRDNQPIIINEMWGNITKLSL